MTGPTSLNRKDLFTFITQYGFDDKFNNDFINLNQSTYDSFNVYRDVTSRNEYKTTVDALLNKASQTEQNKQPYYVLYSTQKDGAILISLIFVKDLNTSISPQSKQTVSLVELKNLIQNEKFRGDIIPLDTSGSINFDIYKSIGETSAGAQLSVFTAAGNPLKSYLFSKKLSDGKTEMLLAVPKISSPTPSLTPSQINEETNKSDQLKNNIQSQVNTLKSIFN